MRRAAPGLRADIESRIAGLERTTPEWAPWLSMLRETAREGRRGERAAAVRVTEPEGASGRGADAPLLHGRAIVLDVKPLVRFGKRLVQAAGDAPALDGFRPTEETFGALIEAIIRGSVEPGTLRTLGDLLAAPVLHAARVALATQLPAHWTQGYCPVCGAWPTLTEHRGMDRARRLRCGRCAADWPMAWLRCAYCGEGHHDRLARLAPEESLESRFVEACATCRHYLKCTSTLTPLTQMELLLRDLETVELDVAALDRGFRRPVAPGFPLTVRVLWKVDG